jgi:hypothetical protein
MRIGSVIALSLPCWASLCHGFTVRNELRLDRPLSTPFVSRRAINDGSDGGNISSGSGRSNKAQSWLLAGALSIALSAPAFAVSGGGLDYANLDISGQDFANGNYKGKDFTQGMLRGVGSFTDTLR